MYLFKKIGIILLMLLVETGLINLIKYLGDFIKQKELNEYLWLNLNILFGFTIILLVGGFVGLVIYICVTISDILDTY